MKLLLPVYTVLLFLGLSVSLHAKSPPRGPILDPEIAPGINRAVASLLTDKKLAGAVTLVAQDGKIRCLQPHGLRSLETESPMTVDTIFRIHSMTKAIVSAAALQQWEKGKYQLSDPVSKFIPAFEKVTVLTKGGEPQSAKKPITIEDLFRHTSGLAYGFSAPPELVDLYGKAKLWGGDWEQFNSELTQIPLVHEPGESWTYGVSTDVLGQLVEIWSGKTLDAYLAEHFFGPLQMTDTGFWIEDEADVKRFATMHLTSEGGIKVGNDPLGQKYLTKPSIMSGGGGLVSTATDYYQFLQMIADGGKRHGQTFLKPETVALMTSNQLPESIANIFFGEEQRTKIGFGLGFSIVTGESRDWDEAAPVGEFGWGGAASCHYWVSPQDDNLIVITLEQTQPYNWNLERTLKPVIYRAVRN